MTRYAPSRGPIYGAYFGDSIMDPFSDAPANIGSGGWPNLLGAISRQKLVMAYNGGVPGQTSAQVLARVGPTLSALLTAKVPISRAFMGEWINDQAQGVPFTTTLANHLAFVHTCWNLGIEPVIVLATPTRTFDYRRQNAGAAGYFAALEVTTVDVLPDLADDRGLLRVEFDRGDGTHQNDAGRMVTARKVLQVLGPFGPAHPYLASTDTDAANLVANGLFTGASTGGLPNDWADAGFGGATATYSVSPAPPQGQTGRPARGNRFRITKTNGAPGSTTTKDIFKQIVTGANVVVGHRYAFACEFAGATQGAFNPDGTLGTRSSYRLVLTWKNGSNAAIGSSLQPLCNWTPNVTDGVAYYETVAPAGAASLQCELVVDGQNPAWFEVGAMTVLDLTALGRAP